MKCFGNLIVVFGSILCNVLYGTTKSFSLIRECRYCWSNHVKTSCIFVSIVLSFCELEFKISKKPKDYKGILVESGVDCFFVGIDIIQKEYIMEIRKIDLIEFDQRWRLLKSVPNF